MPDRINTPAVLEIRDQNTGDTTTPLYSANSSLPTALKHNQSAEFSALVLDVCQGFETCLGLVQKASLDHWSNATCEPEIRPLLSHFGADQLSRLAIASVGMFASAAQARIDLLSKDRQGHA